MITTIEAHELDGVVVPHHVVEIYCPSCSRDVDAQELEALRCNDCGQDLSEPVQSVAIHTTTVPAAGGSTM
jgi:Zn finger protein HypA/HybF involved in hydrogenase expression